MGFYMYIYKHKLESRLPGEISITSDNADDTILMAESEEELKSLLPGVQPTIPAVQADYR